MTLAHDQTLTPDMRIHHQGRIYEVTFVNVDQNYRTATRALLLSLE